MPHIGMLTPRLPDIIQGVFRSPDLDRLLFMKTIIFYIVKLQVQGPTLELTLRTHTTKEQEKQQQEHSPK